MHRPGPQGPLWAHPDPCIGLALKGRYGPTKGQICFKMIDLVKDVLERSKSDYREGSGHEYGQIKVYKL